MPVIPNLDQPWNRPIVGVSKPESVVVGEVSATNLSRISNLLGVNVLPSDTLCFVIFHANGEGYSMQVVENNRLLGV